MMAAEAPVNASIAPKSAEPTWEGAAPRRGGAPGGAGEA